MNVDFQLRAHVWADLLPRYSEPHRHYHNVQHVEECLREFELSQRLAEDSAAVELAILFHDAIYNPKRSDNEEQSAQLAIALLTELVPSATLESIKGQILATKHDAIPTDADSQLLIDIDLAILGQPDERFDQYEKQIRAEYAFIHEPIFRQKRAEILERFLARRHLYQTESFRDRYEKKARENITRSLKFLTV